MLHVLYSFTTSSAYLRNILATIKQYTIEEQLNALKKKKRYSALITRSVGFLVPSPSLVPSPTKPGSIPNFLHIAHRNPKLFEKSAVYTCISCMNSSTPHGVL